MSTEAPAAPAATSLFASRPGSVAEPFDLSGMTDPTLPVTPVVEAPVDDPTPAEPAAQPDEPAVDPVDETEESTADALAALQKEKEAPAAPVEPKAEVKSAAEAPKPETQERDKDLELPQQTQQHVHPKTRKLMEERNAKIREARDRADSLAKEKAELETQLAAAKEAASKTVVPKHVEEQLKTLRERVRELDITRDPEMESKYDKPVAANSARAIELLKGFGLGTRMDKDGKSTAAPEDITALQKAGLSLKTLKPYIDKLEEIGESDAAEELRETVRENLRLSRQKQAEIAQWQGDYDGRVAQRNTVQQQQQEQFNTQVRTIAGETLKNEVAELAKTIPYVLPPVVDPKATPAVQAQQQKALTEFNATKALVEADVKVWDSAGLSPEKATEAHGRLTAAAVKSAILQRHVLPRLVKENQANLAKVAELTAELNRVKNAGSTSRAHAAAAAAPAKDTNIPAEASTADALAAFAKSRGFDV